MVVLMTAASCLNKDLHNSNHYLNQWWLVHWRKCASLGLNEFGVILAPKTYTHMFVQIYMSMRNYNIQIHSGIQPHLSCFDLNSILFYGSISIVLLVTGRLIIFPKIYARQHSTETGHGHCYHKIGPKTFCSITSRRWIVYVHRI